MSAKPHLMVVNVTLLIAADNMATVTVTLGSAGETRNDPRVDDEGRVVYAGNDLQKAKAVTSEWISQMRGQPVSHLPLVEGEVFE